MEYRGEFMYGGAALSCVAPLPNTYYSPSEMRPRKAVPVASPF